VHTTSTLITDTATGTSVFAENTRTMLIVLPLIGVYVRKRHGCLANRLHRVLCGTVSRCLVLYGIRQTKKRGAEENVGE